MKRAFLLIGKETETLWSLALQQALSPLGELHIVPEEEGVQAVTRHDDYEAIIIDAGEVYDVALLTSRLRAQRPEVHVIVATASPTWQIARKVLQAGAADYIRKSLNVEELRSEIEMVLAVPPPSWPR